MIEQIENKGITEKEITTSRLNDIDKIYIELMKFIDPVDLKVGVIYFILFFLNRNY